MTVTMYESKLGWKSLSPSCHANEKDGHGMVMIMMIAMPGMVMRMRIKMRMNESTASTVFGYLRHHASAEGSPSAAGG
jgi:hypothetical protein